MNKVYNESIQSAIKQGFTQKQAEEFTCNKCGRFDFECECENVEENEKSPR